MPVLLDRIERSGFKVVSTSKISVGEDKQRLHAQTFPDGSTHVNEVRHDPANYVLVFSARREGWYGVITNPSRSLRIPLKRTRTVARFRGSNVLGRSVTYKLSPQQKE